MYVYVKSEPQLWTVGFYRPDGRWEPESDHGSSESAAGRVHWLNGSREPVRLEQLEPWLAATAPPTTDAR